jgi:hypothetical protein
MNTVPAWYGAYAAAVVLLGLAGGLKVVRPATTVRALRSARLPANAAMVRMGSAAEVAIAVGALLAGGAVLAGLVAVSYLGFTTFVLLAFLRGGTVSSCGCFGGVDSPPTVLHVALTMAAATVAAAAVSAGGPSLAAVARHRGLLDTAVMAALAGLLAYLAFLAMAVLPKTMAAGTTS